MPLRPTIRQLTRFGFVGAIGFCVDAGVLMLAIRYLQLNLYQGRAVSFLVAATATWLLNRTYTFQHQATESYFIEWLRFTLSNAVGGLVNYAIYAWAVATLSLARHSPPTAVALGSLAGMIINFLMMKFLVFRPSPSAAVRRISARP